MDTSPLSGKRGIHQPDTVEVWYHGAYDGLAIRADVAGEDLAAPPGSPSLSTPNTEIPSAPTEYHGRGEAMPNGIASP